MIPDRTVNAEGQTFKPPEAAKDEEEADSEGYPLCFLCEPSRREDEVVEEMGQHEDGEVECWELERDSVRSGARQGERYVRNGAHRLHGP